MSRDKFIKIAEKEPKLLSLEKDIKLHTAVNLDNENYCANRAWYCKGGFKSRVIELVGEFAENPALRCSEYYDIVSEHLYSLLSDCRHDNDICG